MTDERVVICRACRGRSTLWSATGGYQILQTPGYVVMMIEFTHAYRMIPLDGRPHVGDNIKLWQGDSRGVVSWAVEMSNITNMSRRGIYGSTFKVGDVVTVKVNLLRDGRPGGNYTSITAADGKTYE